MKVLRVITVVLLLTSVGALIACQQPSTVSTVSPTTIPTPDLPYVESQWVLEGRTANLFCHLEKGVTGQYTYRFDKPVDVWFREINEEVITIGGFPTQFPPHHTEIIVGKNITSEDFDEEWNPPGTALYYYMSGIITFSYSIAPTVIDSTVSYYLHIRPVKQGDTITINVRTSEWRE